MGTKYKLFGTLLLEDKTGSKMSSMEHSLGRDVQEINYRIVRDWIAGNGKRPMSWDTLASVLQDVELGWLAGLVRGAKCEQRQRSSGGGVAAGEMASVAEAFK